MTSCEIDLSFSNITSASPFDSPLSLSIYICIIISLIVFMVSTATNNMSQVDKLWSITPIIYTWTAAFSSSRALLMSLLTTLWGIRLTYNFYRRGGYSWPPYSGEEDYRWEIIRQGFLLKVLKHPACWMIFNLTFISFYQNFLLLFIVSPIFVVESVAWQQALCSDNNVATTALSQRQTLYVMDWVATCLFLFFLLVETIADQQQWVFQTEKHRQAVSDRMGEYADGFCQSGLFALVRKPNYAAEQGLWISFYLFSVAATGDLINWSIVGCLLLVLLFQGSGWLTENISREKYPRYEEYMKRVPLYVPLFGNFPNRSAKNE